MQQESELTLVLTWISHMRSNDATELVDDLAEEDPEAGWTVTLRMIELAPTSMLRSVVAAGPLENLLSRHGADFIDRVTELAARDSRMHAAVGGVWISEPEDIAARVHALQETAAPEETIVLADIDRESAQLIVRWFHYFDTAWASRQMEELMESEPADALRIIGIAAATAADENDEDLLFSISVHGLSLMVERANEATLPLLADAVRGNDVFRGWLDERREYEYISDAWQALIDRVDAASG